MCCWHTHDRVSTCTMVKLAQRLPQPLFSLHHLWICDAGDPFSRLAPRGETVHVQSLRRQPDDVELQKHHQAHPDHLPPRWGTKAFPKHCCNRWGWLPHDLGSQADKQGLPTRIPIYYHSGWRLKGCKANGNEGLNKSRVPVLNVAEGSIIISEADLLRLLPWWLDAAVRGGLICCVWMSHS